MDFAASAILSRCFSLELIFNQSEMTWLWVNQINNLGLVRVWETHKYINNEFRSKFKLFSTGVIKLGQSPYAVICWVCELKIQRELHAQV